MRDKNGAQPSCWGSRSAEPDTKILAYLDDSSDDELPTFGAAGSEENMEAMLAVFPILEVVENSIWKLSEALGAHKAADTEQLAVAVDNLGVWLEPVLAAGAGYAV